MSQLVVAEIDRDDAARAREHRAEQTDRPTPPRPTTATVLPGRTCAVLITAPTPVTTAQPNRAAMSSGRVLSITTTEPRSTTAYSA